MIERARWVVAFALRAAADVIEDLADHIDPRPWAGGGVAPVARAAEREDVVPDAPTFDSPHLRRVTLLSMGDVPPFAADLMADQPPHLAAPRPDRPED